MPLETLSKLLCCFTHLEELRFKALETGNEIVVLIMSDEKQLDGHRLSRRHEERAGECECLELLGPQTMARMDTTKVKSDTNSASKRRLKWNGTDTILLSRCVCSVSDYASFSLPDL
jgi:hypothetical protein